MKKEFIVARDQGYPVDQPTFKQLEAVELEEDAVANDVARGYLIPADPDDVRFDEDMARTVVAFRKNKADAQRRAAADEAARKKADEDAEKERAAALEEARKNPPKDQRAENVKAILRGSPGVGAVTSPAAPPDSPPAPTADNSFGEATPSAEQSADRKKK